MDKILTFWTILSLGSELWNLSSREDVKAQRALLDTYKRLEFKCSIFYGFQYLFDN